MRAYAFCRHHRFQPWVLLFSAISVAGVFFGLYRDAVEPVIKPRAKAEQRAKLEKLCVSAHGVIDSVVAMADEIDVRQSVGRSLSRDAMERYLTELVSNAYEYRDPRLLSEARATRAAFLDFYQAPIDHDNPAIMQHRFELMIDAWTHFALIAKPCKASGLFPANSFTLPNYQRRHDTDRFRVSADNLRSFLYSDEIADPLETSETTLQAWRELHDSDIGRGITQYLDGACSAAKLPPLLSRTAYGCKGLANRPFTILAVENYYLGGLVFTACFEGPPYRVLFIYWRAPQGVVDIEEPPLQEADRARLSLYHSCFFAAIKNGDNAPQ